MDLSDRRSQLFGELQDCSVCVLVVPLCRLRAAELSILLFRLYKILLLCSTCNILGNDIFFPGTTTFTTPCERSYNVLQKSSQALGPKPSGKKY